MVELENTSASQEVGSLRQDLRVFDGTAIVVGTTIGSAIFVIPAAIAAQIASPVEVFAVWIVGGLLSVFGALSLAELGSVYPGAGGIYVYLREIYGPLPAFLYGWGLLSMIHSGSIAALAVAFGLYAGHLFSLHAGAQQILSISFIALLTTLNCLGVRSGKLIQNILTILKFSGMVLMIAMLLFRRDNFVLPPLKLGLDGIGSVAPFGIALVAVLFAFEGWHVISFAAGEMKDPRRDLPRSLVFGIVLVTLIYILSNVSYYSVLSPAEISTSQAVASEAIAKAYGTSTSRFISILILLSILGAMNGLVLTGPRVYYAMARDGLFFKRFGRTGSKSGAPVLSLAIQGVWAAALTWSGSYAQIITFVIFTAWMFYGLTVAGVIVLRWREPERDRPYRVPWFPFVPIVFCLAAVGIVLASVIAEPRRALIGVTLVFTGAPVFLLFRYRMTKQVKDV